MSNTQRMISDIIAIHNEAQRLCAAGPWVKIEPGCEMPEDDRHCLVIHSGGVGLCEYDEGRWWHVYEGDGVSGPTHYAVLRMPEGK